MPQHFMFSYECRIVTRTALLCFQIRDVRNFQTHEARQGIGAKARNGWRFNGRQHKLADLACWCFVVHQC